MQPPKITEVTVPNNFAVTPDSNSPISFDEPMKIEFTAVQNLNGIYLHGTVMPQHGKEGKTSDFESIHTSLTKMDSGNFLLEYKYANTANISHSWHKKYTLASHTGWAQLI